MSVTLKNWILVFSLSFVLMNLACSKKDQASFENAGKKMDQGIEDAGDKIEEGLDKAGDKIEDATD